MKNELKTLPLSVGVRVHGGERNTTFATKLELFLNFMSPFLALLEFASKVNGDGMDSSFLLSFITRGDSNTVDLRSLKPAPKK